MYFQVNPELKPLVCLYIYMYLYMYFQVISELKPLVCRYIFMYVCIVKYVQPPMILLFICFTGFCGIHTSRCFTTWILAPWYSPTAMESVCEKELVGKCLAVFFGQFFFTVVCGAKEYFWDDIWIVSWHTPFCQALQSILWAQFLKPPLQKCCRILGLSSFCTALCCRVTSTPALCLASFHILSAK